MTPGRTLFVQMWRPLLALLLASFVVNAALVTGTLQLGSEAQTELRLAHIGEHWARQPPLTQALGLDPVTTLYPRHVLMPAHLQALITPEKRGLFELGPREQDYFVLARGMPDGGVLYIVENHAEVKPRDTLAWQVFSAYLLGIVPFTALLVWLCRRVAARLATPIQQIGRQLEARDPASLLPLPLPAGSPVELQALVTQLNAAHQRAADVLDRERSFTRFASHELRTPAAVMQAALERLEHLAAPNQQPPLARARRGLRDMNALIDTFLALSRDAAPVARPGEQPSTCIDAAWVQALYQHLRGGAAGPVLAITESGALLAAAPDTVLHVLVGNLLKNAVFHGGPDTIQVLIEPDRLQVRNQVLDSAAAGHGLGCQIAERICQRFGWQFSLLRGPQQAVAELCFTPRAGADVRTAPGAADGQR